MNILIWHVHGGWMDAFVRGPHRYLLPTTPARGAWGGGRSGRDWPDNAVEVSPERFREESVDLVVLQRPEEIERAERLLHRRIGRDVPAVYVEHNAPRFSPFATVHPLADRTDIPIVHVTHFNRLMWDNGRAPTVVIEHGVPDPGHIYTGELPALGVVVNEPVRRWRVTGTDLLPAFSRAAPLHLFGIATDRLPDALRVPRADLTIVGDLPPHELHPALARRRAYLHPMRWTSLGLALLEAMHLGMPVLALNTTEAARAVPPDAGAISSNPDELIRESEVLIADPDEAQRRGRFAREFALAHFGLPAFLDNWNTLIDEQVSRARARTVPRLASVASTEGAIR